MRGWRRISSSPVPAGIMTDFDKAEIEGLLRGYGGISLPAFIERLERQMQQLCRDLAVIRRELVAAGVDVPPETEGWELTCTLIPLYEQRHSGQKRRWVRLVCSVGMARHEKGASVLLPLAPTAGACGHHV